MVESEYSMGIYKSSKISIGSGMKNAEMLKFVPDYLKTKKMCKHAVKKLLFLIRCVPDQYKTQQMCDKMVQHYNLFLTATKIKKCVIKQLIITLMH